MKGIDNHIIQLFKKYFGGNTTRLEMRELVQEAKDNPYISDAMEGVDKLSMVDRETAIADLQTKLAKRTGKKQNKIVPMQWLKLAAGIAILLSVGFFIWQPADTNNNMAESSAAEQPTPQIEMKRAAEPAQTTQLESIAFEANKNPFDIEGEQGADMAIEIEEENQKSDDAIDVVHVSDFIVQFPKSNETDRNTTYTEEPVVQIVREDDTDYNIDGIAVKEDLIPESEAEDISKVLEVKKAKAAAREQIINMDDLAAKRESVIPKVDKEKILARQINGTVTDQDGEPLIGVGVVEKDTDNGTVTDIDGSYTLGLTTNTDALIYSYFGSETKEINLGNNDEINVTLEDSRMSLDEVVVTSKSRRGNDGTNKSSSASTPVGGNSSFNTYIDNNLVLPEAAMQNNIKGKVTLLFDVNPAGRPINIEVKKSLGYGCDEEAIRLLEEGPDWEQGDRDEKTKLVVKFKW